MKNFTKYLPILMILTSIWVVTYQIEAQTTLITRGLDIGSGTSSPGTITGTVTNSYNGNPIPGATVTWTTTSVTTLNNGTYTLPDVAVGTQVVSCSAAGYLPQSKTVTIYSNQTTICDFALDPVPAYITGIVRNAADSTPLEGVKLWVTTKYTYSVAGGVYNLQVYPAGNIYIAASKPGFDLFASPAFNVISGNTYTYDIYLQGYANPTSHDSAQLNLTQTAVNLNWHEPEGNYELNYDDGIQDAFTLWAGEGNCNAVKFTPVGMPCQVTGGMINIGTANNYQTGANPMVPFQVAVYDASGPGGTPGQMIGGPFVITPTVLGWVEFNFPSAVDVPSGSFYLVQIQGGNAPNAAGCAIDSTSTQLRSYQKNVTAGGSWVPISGNLMIRAVVFGSGGPLLDLPGNTGGLLGYEVWRLTMGNEANPGTWTSIAQVSGNTAVDNSWPTLNCGPYRWAVKAHYSGNRWSTPAFSNVISKCFTADVTINVGFSCDSTSADYTTVKLTYTSIPDTFRVAVLNGSSSVTFHNMWKGNYMLSVSHFRYESMNLNVTVTNDTTIQVNLMQVKTPPRNLEVDGNILYVTWDAPFFQTPFFTENWSGGSFATNGWIAEGNNWIIANIGQPSPCAEFSWSPEQINYEYSLTSPTTMGVNAPKMWLKFDLSLSANGNTALNNLAVELWDGTAWNNLQTWDNSGGNSFSWFTCTEDISTMVNKPFKIRFRAYGEDSYYINYWAIDNIQFIEANDPTQPDPCLLGYNIFLNNTLGAFTPDTFYHIPPWQVPYGDTCTACVTAIYGSGSSDAICKSFVSHFLCPPSNLAAQTLENVVYLTWSKPNCSMNAPVDFIFDDSSSETGVNINPGYIQWLGNYFPISAGLQGVLQSFDAYFFTNAGGMYYLTLDIFDSTGTNILGSSDPFLIPSDDWVHIPLNDVPFHGPFYAMLKWNNLPASTNWLGEDLDEQGLGFQDLAYHYTGTGSMILVSSYGNNPGVFLLRGHGMINNKKKSLILPAPGTPRPAGTPKSAPPGLAIYPAAGTQPPVKKLNAPAADPTLLGYNIYRNWNFDTYIEGPDVLEYYEIVPHPDRFCYSVTAKYDLSAFGAGISESYESNKACVTLDYCCGLPFNEPWDMGTFAFNAWTLDPTPPGSNWSVNTATGNPAPTVDFSWTPAVTGYDQSIITPFINAVGWTCADIWLDFDYKLVDNMATGAEKLTIEVSLGGGWTQVAEFANNGSVDWNSQHIDISMVKGFSFWVRFRANGANSADILHWYVDNIHAYGVNYPPNDLTFSTDETSISLSWDPPDCNNANVLMDFIFDDGTYEDGLNYSPGIMGWLGNEFPIASNMSGLLQSFHLYFTDNGTGSPQDLLIDVFDSDKILIGSTGAFLVNTPGVWIDVEANNIPFSGLFYVMVRWDNLPGNSYFLGMDVNGPYAPDDLEWTFDGSTFSKQSSVYGFPFLYLIRATALLNANLKQVLLSSGSMHSEGVPARNDGKVLQANRKGDSRNHSVMWPLRIADTSVVVGYNIYRTDNTGEPPFNLISTASGTSYVDSIPTGTGPSVFKYYVTALMEDPVTGNVLTGETPSDTITVNYLLGIREKKDNTISLYPNPAQDLVNMVSTVTIKSIEVLNYIGQTIYAQNNAETKKLRLNVSAWKHGVYIVKVTTDEGIHIVKITVTR